MIKPPPILTGWDHPAGRRRAEAAKLVKYSGNGEPLVSIRNCPMPRPLYGVRRLDEIRGRNSKQWRLGTGRDYKDKRSEAAYARRRKLKARIEQEIDRQAKELRELDEQLAEREKIRDLATKAPTVREMRAAVSQLFKEQNLDPIKELIKLAKVKRGPNALPSKERAAILKELAQYQAPKPKAVDVQADLDMHVSVGLVDFRSAGQRMVREAQPAAQDEEYLEFERDDGVEGGEV